MNFYLINYFSEENTLNKEVKKIIKDISDDYIEVFSNVWFICTPEISINIQQYFSENLTKNEKILITSTEGECSGIGINEEIIEFIKKYTSY